MQMRSKVAAIAIVGSAVLLSVSAPASASVAGPAAAAGRGPAAQAHRHGLTLAGLEKFGKAPLMPAGIVRTPAGRVLDDQLNSDSCTTQPDNPAIHSACTAVGFFADGPTVAGLVESSANGRWGGNLFGGIRTVTDPVEVSCVPQPEDIPVCVTVGEQFNNPKFPVQLVATGGANGFVPDFTASRNPKGSTWSLLDGVSCATATFCMLAGSAGTTRRTPNGLRYLSHATAYRWNGSLHRLAVPAPARSKGTELASVSCPTATSCTAVGNYTSARGRSLPYSARWTNGKWRIQTARTVHGKATSTFEAVSCAAPASCVAVGVATRPASSAFAEKFQGGRWIVQRTVGERQSAFFGVSCPASSQCVAVGQRGTKSLIEAWNGSRWAVRTAPATPGPLTTDALLHVSCVSATLCTAVGLRHNPKVRFAFRTLALGWNGSSWRIQKTINE